MPWALLLSVGVERLQNEYLYAVGYGEALRIPEKSHLDGSRQCDQKKIAKCLEKLPKRDFTRKMNDFNTFTNIAQECGRFGQINCCQMLEKDAQSPINRQIWSHW